MQDTEWEDVVVDNSQSIVGGYIEDTEWEDIKPSTKSVMDASDGKIYNVPVNMDATDINFNIQTQHKGLNKADFFGKVATSLNPINAIDRIKDTYNQISNAIDNGNLTKEDINEAFVKSGKQLAQNITKPASKVAEFVTESNTSKAIAKSVVDVGGSFANTVIDTVTGFQDLEIAKETGIAPDSFIAGARVRFDAIVNGTDYKTSVNKLLESTRKLKEKNKKFFEETSENILPSEEMDKLDHLIYGVSNGLTSIGAAVGAAVLTKNPTVGSAMVAASFGKMQQSEYYDKSREAGYSAERSQFYGNIAGVANAGLEFVGNKILLGLGGVKPIKAINENVIKATIAKLGKNEATKGAAAKIISKHLNSAVKQGFKAYGSEFGEEFLQEGFEAMLEKATGVTNASWSDVLNNAIYSGFIGGISGGIFGSASTAITNKQIKAHNDKIKGFISATQSGLTEEEVQVTADIVQEMLFQEASNYQDQVSKHIEKELDIDVAPEGLTRESLIKQTRDSLKSKFGMTDEEIDKYCDSALTAIDARNQYNEVFTGFRDALIGIGIDSNKASATAQLLSARALSAALDGKTTAQEIVKRFKLKFERENFNKDNYKSVLEDDYIPFQESLDVAKQNAELDKVNPKYEGETININGVEKTVYNSTGERIAKSKEALENFYNWFGDSKVIDEQGRPLVVYHGTNKEFDSFDKSKIGKNYSKLGGGFYFTNQQREAKGYGKTFNVYILLKNPINITNNSKNITKEQRQRLIDYLKNDVKHLRDNMTSDDEMFLHDLYFDINYNVRNEKFSEAIKNVLGADGIVNRVATSKYDNNLFEYVAFNPNQIKSTSNRGTYSESDNIYYQSSLSSKTRVKAREVKNALQEIANGAEEATVKDLRNDLDQYGGTNDVTFVYGDAKKGLFHIANKHGGMKTLLKVLDAVVDGNIARYSNTKKTVVVEKDGYEAVLSLDENGNKKTWLLTGWNTKISPDAEREFSATLKATQQEPTFSRQLLGAGLNDISITPNSEKVNSKVQNQGEQSNPRGAYDVTNHIIKLFETADTSTLIHELGHFFLEDLKDYANDVNSINMLEEVYRYLGVKDGVITSEQHELFADSFEKYVLNGKAPNSTLAKCFQAFARWLRNLKYEIQRLGNVKLSDDITKTFDKMLGGKALDFAMQNSSLQLQEQLDSGNLPKHIIDRAIKMLEDGVISRSDMDDIVAKLRTGELKKKEVAAELKRLEGLNVKHHEMLNPFDTMKYRQQLSAGNFDKAKVIAKIERLVEWTKPRTSGGKEVGRFPNKQLNDLFDNVRNILAMSKEDARAKIRENLDKLGDAFTTQSALDDGETREALIFENKLLSIPAKRTSAQSLIDVYNALSESYNLGRLSDTLTKRAKKERREGMIKTALQTIAGGVNPSIEQSKISQFLNKLGSSQYAWQGLLDILSMNDKTSKTGKSALNKMLDVFESEQQEAKGVADDGEIFSEIAARKFASNNNHKIALSRYVDKELSKESILTWGRYRKKFTKDQLIDIYMKSLDPETREIMINDEINGFNEDFLSLVKQELTSDDLAFADALFEFYKQNYDKINPYYEERFGVSLGKRDYYSPRSMERTGTNLDTGDIISFAGFGNIKKRTVKNKGTLKVKGAFKTFNEYVVNSNHYLAWSEKLIDINAVFGNVEIKNAISNIFGKSMLNRIDYEISRFASNDTFQKKFSLGVNFNKLRSNYAKSVLGLKPSLAIKQLTSFPAYLENMSSVEFMTGVTDFFKHPKEAMELLGNTTLMKTRDVNIIKDFAELSKLDILKGKSGVKFSDLMMLNIKLGDRGAIYVGGWALYKAELKKNLAKGMTQAEAKKKALETFERVTDETQQSGRMSQQSYWQSNPFLRAFTMFQSSQNQYFRKELNAVRGLVTGRMDGKQAAKTIFIYHFLLPMLFQYASDGFEWDKDAQLRTALIGSINGVFVLNALLGKLYDAASTGSFTSGTMRVRDVIPFYGAIEDMSKFLVKLLNGEIEPDWSDYMDVLETFSKPLQTVGELAGLPVKYPLDVIKNFGSYAEDEEYGKETLLWLGWSPYALRDKE